MDSTVTPTFKMAYILNILPKLTFQVCLGEGILLKCIETHIKEYLNWSASPL